MKKFFAVILMLAVLTALCACAPAEGENPSLPESSSEPEESKSVPSSADEPAYAFLGMADDTEIYCKAIPKEGTRPKLVPGKNGELNSTIKVPIIEELWIVDANGSNLIDHPFYNCVLKDDSFFQSYGYDALCGHYDGNDYHYDFIDGEFVLRQFPIRGEMGFSGDQWGYKMTHYCLELGSNGWDYCYGLNDENGNMIFEPVHSDIFVPFKDRFLLGVGTRGGLAEEIAFTLVDVEGNTYAQFNWLSFSVFEDGSYIGVAWSAGTEHRTIHDEYCYDENGDPREEGYWLIDKNGNILSERYEKLYIDSEWNFETDDKESVVYVVKSDGSVDSFPVRDILQKG